MVWQARGAHGTIKHGNRSLRRICMLRASAKTQRIDQWRPGPHGEILQHTAAGASYIQPCIQDAHALVRVLTAPRQKSNAGFFCGLCARAPVLGFSYRSSHARRCRDRGELLRGWCLELWAPGSLQNCPKRLVDGNLGKGPSACQPSATVLAAGGHRT